MSSTSRSQRLRVQKNVQDEKSAKKCQKSENGFAKGKENESSSSVKKVSEKSDSNPKDPLVNLVGGRPKREVKKTEKAKLLEETKQTKTPKIAGTDFKSSQSDTPKVPMATRTKRGPTPKTEIRFEKRNKKVTPDTNDQELSVPDGIAPNVVSKRGNRKKVASGT